MGNGKMKLPLFDNYTLRNFQKEDAHSLADCANNEKIAANLRDRFPHPYH